MVQWRLAKSLDTLRDQVNARWPSRSKISDGSIGNAAHSARISDHNPDEHGVVHAIDVTNDPDHGLSSEKLAQALLMSRDTRIKYIISNKKIASGDEGPLPWKWRTYMGVNPHNHHCHISVKTAHADDVSPWNFNL